MFEIKSISAGLILILLRRKHKFFAKSRSRIDILRKKMYNLRKESYADYNMIGDDGSEDQ